MAAARIRINISRKDWSLFAAGKAAVKSKLLRTVNKNLEEIQDPIVKQLAKLEKLLLEIIFLEK